MSRSQNLLIRVGLDSLGEGEILVTQAESLRGRKLRNLIIAIALHAVAHLPDEVGIGLVWYSLVGADEGIGQGSAYLIIHHVTIRRILIVPATTEKLHIGLHFAGNASYQAPVSILLRQVNARSKPVPEWQQSMTAVIFTPEGSGSSCGCCDIVCENIDRQFWLQ